MVLYGHGTTVNPFPIQPNTIILIGFLICVAIIACIEVYDWKRTHKKITIPNRILPAGIKIPIHSVPSFWRWQLMNVTTFSYPYLLLFEDKIEYKDLLKKETRYISDIQEVSAEKYWTIKITFKQEPLEREFIVPLLYIPSVLAYFQQRKIPLSANALTRLK